MSLLDRAFVKAYSRSQSANSSPVAPPHLDIHNSASNASRLAIAEMVQVQDAFASSVLLDDSYFRVDVGHSPIVRSGPPVQAKPAAESRGAQINAVPMGTGRVNAAPMNPAVISHTLTAYDLPAESVERSHAQADGLQSGSSVSTPSTATVKALRMRIDNPHGTRQWVPPAIEEPQEHYRVQRDEHQANEFARAKSETFARETPYASPTVAQQNMAAAAAFSPLASTPREALFEPVWEVDAFEFSDTIIALFGDAKLMKSIGTPLDQAVANGLRSILITSSDRYAGRTTVAVGIAVSAASAGLRVALVDADKATGGLAEALRLEVQNDWLEAVRNNLPLDEVAIRSIEDQVTVLPTLAAADDSAIMPKEFDKMMVRLRDSFDLIVIDGSPWSSSSLALQKASTIDAAIIVIDARRDVMEQVTPIQDHFRRAGVAGLGIVENYS